MGFLEKNEDPEQAARREIEEETGKKAGEMTSLGSIYPNPGVLTQQTYVYYTNELSQGIQHLDDTEADLQHKFYSYKELVKMINNGEMKNGISLAAFAKYLIM